MTQERRNRKTSRKWELVVNKKAQAAINAEWRRLRDKGVWDEDAVEAWGAVRARRGHTRGAHLRHYR